MFWIPSRYRTIHDSVKSPFRVALNQTTRSVQDLCRRREGGRSRIWHEVWNRAARYVDKNLLNSSNEVHEARRIWKNTIGVTDVAIRFSK